MNVGSLFSGIGGLDLGLERAGMTVVWQSEIDPYASRVLAKHWPHVPNLGDVTTIDWGSVERPDLICGGYPCQPFSLAGDRRGGADPRHLWPHFHRAIRHLRPRYALLENVPGHLSMGFDRVLGDLAEIGYDTEWCCIPAAAVGAPHLRYRIFAIAYPCGSRRREVCGSAPGNEGSNEGRAAQHDGPIGALADAGSGGLDGWPSVERTGREAPVGRQEIDHAGDGGNPCGAVADVSIVGPQGRSDGVGHDSASSRDGRSESPRSGRRITPSDDWWSTEPDVGRVAYGVPHRVDRLRTLGNAVVPQVAEWVGRRIVEAAA